MSPLITWVVIATDGTTLRTLHRPAFGPDAAATLDRLVREGMGEITIPSPAATPKLPPSLAVQHGRSPPPTATAMMTQGEIASSIGFTGDACNTCGAFLMKRVGTCLTCQSCGSTTGCS